MENKKREIILYILLIIIIFLGIYLVYPKYEFTFPQPTSSLNFVRTNKITGEVEWWLWDKGKEGEGNAKWIVLKNTKKSCVQFVSINKPNDRKNSF